MILSRPHNPPYQTPKSSISPPPGPSPKRKRAETTASVKGPQVDTAQLSERVPESGADSPRTKVAERFQDLNIQQTASLISRKPTGLPRKRLKRNAPLKVPVSENELSDEHNPTSEVENETPIRVWRAASPVVEIEIQETPDCRLQTRSSPPVSPALKGKQNISPVDSPQRPSKRFLSPPPSKRFLSSGAGGMVFTAGPRASSPLPTSEDISSDQTVLTWQEDEITGHDIDRVAGDDGEGINGIGFRPTPAIAYVRSQKRKQQVSEWRAREAREARQRRFERRRGGGAGAEARSDPAPRRMVRFESGDEDE